METRASFFCEAIKEIGNLGEAKSEILYDVKLVQEQNNQEIFVQKNKHFKSNIFSTHID